METSKKKTSIILKDMAKRQLLGNYQTVILAYFAMELIISLPLQLLQKILNLNSTGGSLIYMVATIIIALITAVFHLGQCNLYLKLARGLGCQLSDMWYGFRGFADKAIVAQLIIMVKSFVTGIPFIILAGVTAATKSYYVLPFAGVACVFFMIATAYIQLTYSQVPYVMIDRPELSASEALTESARIMKGNKLRFFYLQVSFIGMWILGFVSLYVGFFWIMPYMSMTKADFYEDLR